jgi:hypothetical protein
MVGIQGLSARPQTEANVFITQLKESVHERRLGQPNIEKLLQAF